MDADQRHLRDRGPTPARPDPDADRTLPTEQADDAWHADPTLKDDPTATEATDLTLAAEPSGGEDTQATVKMDEPAPPPSGGQTTVATGAHRADTDPLIGTVVGGIRLTSKLGAGGMGAVYRGRHETLDIDVAVKLLHPDASDAERFLREAKAAAAIKHPNVVGVQNAGREGASLYIAMDLVAGGDLNEAVRDHGRMPWRDAVAAMAEAADGLGAAHAAGIVHRDVKLANLLRADDGRIQVADLGLAKRRDLDTELTKTGTVMGTPAYMAPEQAVDSRTAGPPADIYALGVCLWRLITGELPFTGVTSTQVILAHINDPLPDLRTKGGDYPDHLITLLERFLAKDPTQRPADGVAAAAELRGVLDGTAPPAPKPVQAPTPMRAEQVGGDGGPRSRPAAVIGLIAVIALVVGLTWTLTRGGDDEPATAAAQAAAPAPGEAPAAGAPAAQADTWRTPVRAAFIQSADDLGANAALERGVLDSGLRLIERREIAALVGEQDLIRTRNVDPDSAVRLGGLIGGHLAIIAAMTDDGLHLRSVEIETGAIVDSRVVPPDSAGSIATEMATAAAATLPARGRLSKLPDGSWEIDLGRRHGIHAGEKLAVHAGTPDEPGPAVAIAVVGDDPGAERAEVTVAGTEPTRLPALVERRAP